MDSVLASIAVDRRFEPR